jgi:hypothetical protein
MAGCEQPENQDKTLRSPNLVIVFRAVYTLPRKVLILGQSILAKTIHDTWEQPREFGGTHTVTTPAAEKVRKVRCIHMLLYREMRL